MTEYKIVPKYYIFLQLANLHCTLIIRNVESKTFLTSIRGCHS